MIACLSHSKLKTIKIPAISHYRDYTSVTSWLINRAPTIILNPLMILALYHLNFTSVLGKPNKSSGQIPLAIMNTRLITVDVDTCN